MNVEDFEQQIDMVRQRTDWLNIQVSKSPWQEQDLLVQAVEELQVALEELHVAEEELRQQNEQLAVARALVEVERQRYHELFEFAPDGYLVTDTYGTIKEANRAAATLLNFPQQFLLGKPLSNFIPIEERRAFRFQLIQLQFMERMQEWEITLQSYRGNIKYVSISITTIRDHQGKPSGWRWLLRDITARKQEEEKMRSIQLQNMQLQEAAKLKSHFLAIVSHELRTPMNAILGFSQLLLRNPYHQLAPQARSMVERILDSGRHLLTLIDEMLDLTRLEAGRLELTLEQFNLADLVTAVTEELDCLAAQKNLTLDIYIKLENPVVVNDNGRVRQILVNLLANAIKFTNTGGICVEVLEEQDQVALIVKDTGIGIPEADLEHIFKEFRQVNQSITRQHGGTGLGLAIADQLVQLMKGTIKVESKLGEGSTFRVELPRQVKQ